MHERIQANAAIDPLVGPLPKIGAGLRQAVCLVFVRHGWRLGQDLFRCHQLAKILIANLQGAVFDLELEVIHRPR